MLTLSGQDLMPKAKRYNCQLQNLYEVVGKKENWDWDYLEKQNKVYIFLGPTV